MDRTGLFPILPAQRRPLARTWRFTPPLAATVLLAATALLAGCGSRDEVAPTRSVQLVPFELSDSTVAAVLPLLQDAIDGSRLTAEPRARVILLGTPSPEAQSRIRSETEDGGFLVAELDLGVFERVPPVVTAADLRFFVFDEVEDEGRPVTQPTASGIRPEPRIGSEGDHRPTLAPSAFSRPPRIPDADQELRAAVRDLLEALADAGVDTNALDGAWQESLFYDAAGFPCGLPSGTEEGASFPWGGASVFNVASSDWWIFFWWDGRSHVVLASNRVAALEGGEFFQAGGAPTQATATVLHELTHVVLARTECGEDDDEDELVGSLEAALTTRIALQNQKRAGGASYGAVANYSDAVAVALDRGGAGCLVELGLPYATDIQVTAPERVVIDEPSVIAITVLDPEGEPLAGFDVAVSIGEERRAFVTDASGQVQAAFTAPSSAEEDLVVVVSAGSVRHEARIEVIDTNVTGACCLPDLTCEQLTGPTCKARGGTYQGSGLACDPSPCSDLGACCSDDGSCLLRHREACEFLQYAFLGVGTVCDPDPCAAVDGGCCAGTTCTVTTREECQTSGGEVWWPGADCDPNPCVERGACCADDGSCTLTTRQECLALDRFYAGDTTVCDPNPCPQPGACCSSEAVCTVVTVLDCDATFLGEGTDCEPNPCSSPTTGACCTLLACLVLTEQGCAAEQHSYFLGVGTSCDPEPCFGACCLLQGNCLIRTSRSCEESEGDFYGFDSECPPEPCAEQRGACCLPEGGCLVLTGAECVVGRKGIYAPGQPCASRDCSLWEVGACCFPDESCDVGYASGCPNFQGAGTTCDPNPCLAPTGACCAVTGECSISTAAECLFGIYEGDGSDCDPDPCTPLGACCLPSGECDATLDVTECDDLGGAYQFLAPGCDPNPCDGPVGACCYNGGCYIFHRSLCQMLEGFFVGEGTTCDPSPC